MTYTIEKVTTLIGAHRFGTADANIGFLLTDSRSLCFAEETLFFALKSGRNDGHNYISDLYRRGVRNFVVEDVPADYNTTYADANFLKVENSLVAPAATRRASPRGIRHTYCGHHGQQRKDHREGMALPVALSGDEGYALAA